MKMKDKQRKAMFAKKKNNPSTIEYGKLDDLDNFKKTGEIMSEFDARKNQQRYMLYEKDGREMLIVPAKYSPYWWRKATMRDINRVSVR